MQNAIFNVFRGANVRVVKPEQAVAEVHITFSEDWQGYLLIADIQQGSTSQTVIKKLPRPQQAQAAHATTLTIRKIRYGSRKRPFWIFIRTARTCWCLSPVSFRCTQFPDSGVRGKRWAFRTRTRGHATCAGSWKFTAENSMSFFPARVAAGKFLLHRSIAAPVTIPGPSAKGWSRSSAHAGISSMACWQDRAQALLCFLLFWSNMAKRRPACLAFYRHRRPHAAFSK